MRMHRLSDTEKIHREFYRNRKAIGNVFPREEYVLDSEKAQRKWK